VVDVGHTLRQVGQVDLVVEAVPGTAVDLERLGKGMLGALGFLAAAAAPAPAAAALGALDLAPLDIRGQMVEPDIAVRSVVRLPITLQVAAEAGIPRV
jgi:hypothetical protein